MGIAEFIIGRAFARPVGSSHPTEAEAGDRGTRLANPHGCDNRGPPTRTIILAIRGFYELWCRSVRYEPKVLRGSRRFVTAATVRFRAQNTSPKQQRPANGAVELPKRTGHWRLG